MIDAPDTDPAPRLSPAEIRLANANERRLTEVHRLLASGDRTAAADVFAVFAVENSILIGDNDARVHQAAAAARLDPASSKRQPKRRNR